MSSKLQKYISANLFSKSSPKVPILQGRTFHKPKTRNQKLMLYLQTTKQNLWNVLVAEQ